ncbi:MAG: methionyl-tRNA formyltransferase [Actinomycetota bacterium]
MRVAFLGSQEIGRRCLEVIADAGHDIVTVGTFDPPAHESWGHEVADFAAERNIARLTDPRFRSAEAVAELRDHRPDIIFVIGWRWILAPEVLTIAPKGVLGIHGSLLPRLRGFAPVNWALIRGEAETGPTLFFFDDGCDTGDIVAQRPFPITDDDDAQTIRDRITDVSVDLLRDTLPALADGSAPRIEQDHNHATFGPQRRPDDGAIDWNLTTTEVVNWVRGLTRPYPGAFLVAGERPVRVWRVQPTTGSAEPGTVLAHDPTVVATNDGAVALVDAEPLDVAVGARLDASVPA